MAMRTFWLFATALSLSACDNASAPERGAPGTVEPEPVVPKTVVTVANPYHDRLLALSELQRLAALRTAIRAARESCNRVESAVFQQDHENLKMWTATCARNDYAVFLAPNADVQVRKCADLASLKLPLCRATPKL